MPTLDPHTIYELLESFDTSKILEALELLKTDASLKKVVESRYLNFVRIRLNDPKASIFDYPNAALSHEEYDFMLKKFQSFYDDKCMNFSGCDTQEMKLVVDVMGALVRANVKLLHFISKVKQTTEEFYIPDVVVSFREQLKSSLGDQIFIHSEGWYSRLSTKLYNISTINALILEDTDASSVNDSLGLEGFMLFLILNQEGETTFKIGSNPSISFTKLFWMFINVPNVYWPEGVKPEFPESVLSYTRVVAYQMRGDDSGFYYGEK